MSRGTADLCLHRFEPRVGDCVFLPAGAVHALGAGLVVAEPGMFERLVAVGADWRGAPMLGPDRDELLKTVAG